MALNPRSVLVVAVPVMGDVLLSTPLIRSIKAAWPDARIDVLTRPGGGAVLEGNPDVNERLELHKKPPKRELAAFLLRRFRRYDLVLSNSASDRAFIYALMMGKTRISLVYPLHSNMALKQRFYRYSEIIDYERYNTVVQNLKLVDHLDVQKRYEVVLPTSSGSASVLADALGADWRKQPLAILQPNTAGTFKRWTASGWRRVALHLAERELKVLVAGGPSAADRDYISSLGLDGVAESVAGRLSLADVALLLTSVRICVGVDTLVSHMAAAAGAPTVVLFGPTNPVTWGPWPFGWEGGDSPWQKAGSQHIGNVTVVQPDNDTAMDSLDAGPVVAAIDAAFATAGGCPARS